MFRKLILILVTVFAAVGMVQAELTLELQVPGSSLVKGDELTVQLKADGAETGAALLLPDVPGLAFRQLGPPSSSSQTVIINGKVNRFSGLIFNIGISGLKKGEYRVPGIQLSYQNKTYTSRPFELRVVSPNAESSMKVMLSASRKSLYPDEPLVVTLKWYLQDSIQDYAFRFPLLEQKDRLQLQLADASGTSATRELNVNGYKIPFRRGGETLNGESYTVYETALRIFLPEPGEFQIPAASVRAMVQRGTELKRDFFDRLVRTPKLQRIFAVSDPLTIQVKVLPTEGRPACFTGGIGNFDVQLSASQTRVRIGDPIELAIRISGNGRFFKIEQPVLNDIPGYSEHFVIVDNLQPGDIQDGSITFRQVIRARSETVTTIPPVQFAYFDPEQERYVTIKSNSIPLKVLPSKQITAADIVKPGEDNPVVEAVLLEKKRGIYGNYTFQDALVSRDRHFAWFLMLLIPPVTYFIVVLMVQRQRRLNNNQALVRFRAARGKSSRRLKKARNLISGDSTEFLTEISQVVSGYISDKFDLGAGEVTVYDIKQLVTGQRMPESLSNDLVAHLEMFDRMRFSSREVSMEERREILAAVEKSLGMLEKQL